MMRVMEFSLLNGTADSPSPLYGQRGVPWKCVCYKDQFEILEATLEKILNRIEAFLYFEMTFTPLFLERGVPEGRGESNKAWK